MNPPLDADRFALAICEIKPTTARRARNMRSGKSKPPRTPTRDIEFATANPPILKINARTGIVTRWD
jgi:hypothetical protein